MNNFVIRRRMTIGQRFGFRRRGGDVGRAVRPYTRRSRVNIQQQADIAKRTSLVSFGSSDLQSALTRRTGRRIARRSRRYYREIQMQTISLKIPDELLAKLERAARAKRVTKSDLVRESLETALRPRGGSLSCFDLAEDLAGSVKGLPRDLAHNPKYLNGFGE